ncbi:MAG: SPOR domain-containing protein, partial [Alistipes sp.]|nr:SPOR domain-containing protein [Alistipes sp.]
MKRFVLIISMLFCAFVMKAQSNIVHELEADVPGQGSVKVNQPARLFDLMGSMVTIDGKAPEVEGYRVMVYSGNNSRQARDEANAMADYMRTKFPGS